MGAPFSDMPGDAGVTSHDMEHGDVLVFATDGVWDNLSSQDMLEVVSARMERGGVWVDRKEGPAVGESLLELMEERKGKDNSTLHTALATDIVKIAKEHGLNSRRDGPFAREFQKKYPEEGYHGGKPDDIAVIVAIAVDQGAAAGSGSTSGESKL